MGAIGRTSGAKPYDVYDKAEVYNKTEADGLLDTKLTTSDLLDAIKEVDENDSGINATTVNGTPKELLGIGGEGYQLVDETSNRTNDEEYTNTSQSALFVNIGVRSGDNQYVALYVGDIEVCRAGEDGISGATTDALSAVVPQGFTYELKRSSDKDVNIDSWSELKKV